MSDNVSINDLPPKATGHGVVLPTVEDWNAILSLLWAGWHGENVNTGQGINRTSSPGMGWAFAGATGGQGTASPDFPWKISTRPKPGVPNQYQAMVSINSDILLSLKPSDKLDVTGLETWFDFISVDVIWIYIVVAAQTATSATIQSYGQGNSGFTPTSAAWDDDGGYVQDDGGTPPQQIAANVMIAYSEPDDKGKPVLYQAASSHFLIKSMCIDGKPAQFAQPSPYRRYGLTP